MTLRALTVAAGAQREPSKPMIESSESEHKLDLLRKAEHNARTNQVFWVGRHGLHRSGSQRVTAKVKTKSGVTKLAPACSWWARIAMPQDPACASGLRTRRPGWVGKPVVRVSLQAEEGQWLAQFRSRPCSLRVSVTRWQRCDRFAAIQVTSCCGCVVHAIPDTVPL